MIYWLISNNQGLVKEHQHITHIKQYREKNPIFDKTNKTKNVHNLIPLK